MKNSIDTVTQIDSCKSSPQEWTRIMTPEQLLLAAIVFVSVAIKILFAFVDPVINVDGVVYIAAAKQIAAKDFREALEIYSMPFYPLLIAIMNGLVHDWVWAARIISFFSMVLTIFPLYLIAKELFGQRVALWSCLVFALAPLPNEWAMDVIRDPAFLFCFAWAVYFCIRVITLKKNIYCFPAVVFAWAAILFRIEGIVLFPAVFIIFVYFLTRNRSDRKFWRQGIGAWLALSVFAGGVLVGTALMSDTVSLNRLNEVGQEIGEIGRIDFLDNYHALYAEFKKLEGTPPFSDGNQNILAITRHYMAVIYVFGILEFMIRVLFPVFLIPLVLGFGGYRWERKHGFVITVMLIYLLMVYYSLIKRDFLEIRFVFLPVFLLYPWVGNGLDRIWNRVKKTKCPRIIVVMFFTLFIVLPLYKTGNNIYCQDAILREAGHWLAKAPEFADARLATTDSRISFYADKDNDSVLHISDKKIRNKYAVVEKMALQDKAELIAEKVRKGNGPFEAFGHYRVIKTFKGNINWVHFYRFVRD
jgi:4-amino-4-deoxy-L-arabinose transferase-like glycosyltransferase